MKVIIIPEAEVGYYDREVAPIIEGFSDNTKVLDVPDATPALILYPWHISRTYKPSQEMEQIASDAMARIVKAMESIYGKQFWLGSKMSEEMHPLDSQERFSELATRMGWPVPECVTCEQFLGRAIDPNGFLIMDIGDHMISQHHTEWSLAMKDGAADVASVVQDANPIPTRCFEHFETDEHFVNGPPAVGHCSLLTGHDGPHGIFQLMHACEKRDHIKCGPCMRGDCRDCLAQREPNHDLCTTKS